jgi:hypothetical protein
MNYLSRGNTARVSLKQKHVTEYTKPKPKPKSKPEELCAEKKSTQDAAVAYISHNRLDSSKPSHASKQKKKHGRSTMFRNVSLTQDIETHAQRLNAEEVLRVAQIGFRTTEVLQLKHWSYAEHVILALRSADRQHRDE